MKDGEKWLLRYAESGGAAHRRFWLSSKNWRVSQHPQQGEGWNNTFSKAFISASDVRGQAHGDTDIFADHRQFDEKQAPTNKELASKMILSLQAHVLPVSSLQNVLLMEYRC